MRPLTIITLLFLVTQIFAVRPRVPWPSDVRFVLDREVSDDFRGSELDLDKWDPHGVRVPDTGCPRWNGPPSTDFPDYSTFFPTTTNPQTGLRTEKQYRLSRGRLLLKMDEKPLEYFTSREYYCNATTFKCNHDDSIDCFATDIFGMPRYADAAKTMFKAIVHDKCKREPFCIPHPEFVTGEPRIYKRFVGAHLTGKKSFKYGYAEVRVRLGYSPAVAAAWMHDDNLVDGYCRLVRVEGRTNPRLECPSRIRSRRWQEIDVLESMNSRIHRRLFIPNIHAFSAYKGEFTSDTSADNGDGTAGGGPIIVEQRVFDLQNPNFSDVPSAQRIGNDYHYNPGSVTQLNRDWAGGIRYVGMYWSPKEIRFLIDGVEVRRVKNNIIHQPMFLDLSYALNVAWAQEFPRPRHIRQEVKFFHFRRWEVLTPDGAEPPSTLPFDNDQDTDFRNLYGSELGGVFGRFPANDDETVTLTNPDERDTVEPTLAPTRRDEREEAMSTLSKMRGNTDYFKTRASVRQGKLTDEEVEINNLVSKGYRPAGGPGNARFPSEVPKMTSYERRVAEGRDDRAADVEDGEAEMIEDGAVTVYEFADPNENAAGWSTPQGLGKLT